MGDDLSLDQRDAVRTPMQWSDEPQAGFSISKTTVHPLIDEGVYSFERVNVESQRRNPDSLLSWMSRMIRLRKECPEIGWGDWEILRPNAPGVLAMRYEWRGACLVTVHNFRDVPCEVELALDVEGGETLVDLLHDRRSESASSRHKIALEPYAYHWYRVGGMSYTLTRRRNGTG